ncbi:iron complex transport system ATP-binding protein [Enterococcus sp. PF1-24]|uniref:ABC transporter ATP-binding protein n=1 Tax=unclassified Enterococcus TaxID=2608891 RepID=UPI00247654B1|nr:MULTISPECIES: ABC transporter ATP-binding protein [unclassified Enterococcus]MDH6365259.1 iron complex transport system ATP-binding protein [Enterococcus sp. PFB1-1]MDH6402360.1 iron complex transport system ATP-binding protein [Enterococcus sp. PF1-24]
MKILSFEGVSLQREQKTLLKNINWEIEANEHWGILGLNGAGKTLLLQLITGSYWPSAGRLEVLGEVFGRTSIPELQKRIGWVSTALQYRIRPSELSEMIVLSGKFASIGIYQKYTPQELAQAKELLVNFQAEDLIGKPYQLLSQGERQIVLIARALMAKPEMLILDEPCNGLDLFAREQLLTTIEKLAKDKNAPTLLFVTHHTEELLPIFDKLLMIKDGSVFAQGNRAELFTKEKLAAFYEKPITFYPINQQRLMVLPAE